MKTNKKTKIPLGRLIKLSFKIRELQEIINQNLILVIHVELRNQEGCFVFL